MSQSDMKSINRDLAANAEPAPPPQGAPEEFFSTAPGQQPQEATEQQPQQYTERQQPQTMDAEEFKRQALQKRDEMAQAVKSRAESYFDQQKQTLANVIQDVTAATRHCVSELEQKNHPTVGEYTGVLAGQMDSLAQTLREKDLNYLLHQAQDFARRRPALFLGGALALGFAAVRFFKSSNQITGQDREASSGGPSEGVHNDIPAGSGTQFTI